MNLDEIYKEYLAIKPLFETACEELYRQINILLDENDIKLAFPIQHRVKSWESVENKVRTNVIDIKKSVLEMQDIGGLRLIVLEKRHIDVIIDLINNKFNIRKDYDTLERLKENQFGYSSRHLLIELKEERFEVPSLKYAKGLQFEIQLRTLSQHSWAEMSNTLQYKREEDAPQRLKRPVNRMAALLELIDEEFVRLIIEKEQHVESLHISTSKKRTLDVDLLEHMLGKIPPENRKRDKEGYASLLQELNQAGLSLESELKILIDKNLSKVLEFEKEIVSELLKIVDDPSVDKVHIASIQETYVVGEDRDSIFDKIYFTDTGIIRVAVKMQMNKELYKLIRAGEKIVLD